MMILEKAKGMLDKDEELLICLECSIRTFIYRQVYRPGVLLATNKRLLFYGMNLSGVELVEKYDYDNISSIKEIKGVLKNSIAMNIEGESVKFSNILSNNKEKFIDIVKNKCLKTNI